MSRTVFCRKFQREMEGLERPPYPGPRGQMVFAEVSKEAWQAWLKHQTMLINEKHLNLMSPDTQTYLAQELEKFLDGDQYDKPEGYVPPEQV